MLKPYDVELSAEQTAFPPSPDVQEAHPAAQTESKEAVRARHQRADARSDEPVPLRRARRLPADRDAGGARRAQARPVRRVAQRAPGEPLPRRDRVSGSADDIKKGTGAQDQGRAAVEAAGSSCRPRRSTASLPATLRRRQDRQPDPRRWCASCRTSDAAARSRAGVERHQHAHQGARPRARRRGLLQRQGARGRRPPLHRRARPAEGLLGQPRQGHGVVEEGRPHLLPRARAAGAEAARERVRLRRVRRAAALRAGQGGRGPHGGARDAARLHPRARTRCGASPRATASRTSR